MVALFLFALIVALGVAALCGWTVDSRDPEYSLGRLIEWDATRHSDNR